MESPELVTLAHCNFITAGAQVITTTSYAVVPYHIGGPLYAERGRELIALSGKLAKAAVEQYPGRQRSVPSWHDH